MIWAAPSAGSMILALALEILMTHHVVASVRMVREVYDGFIDHCMLFGTCAIFWCSSVQ